MKDIKIPLKKSRINNLQSLALRQPVNARVNPWKTIQFIDGQETRTTEIIKSKREEIKIDKLKRRD